MATAGQGARQQQAAAQRRVEEAERNLANARTTEHAWCVGASGEEQVADALLGLEQLGWVIMHDVAWPGRPRANLDHVLIGPGGVLIVDTKNWSGTVTVDTARGLRCNGYRKAKEVTGIEAARQAVLPLVPGVVPELVASIICLAAQDQEPVRLDGGTVVVGRAQLRQHLIDLPPVLTAQGVVEVAMSLGPAVQRLVNSVPTQATRGSKPAGRPKSRKRKDRGLGPTAAKLAVLGVLIGGFLVFPDQVLRVYMSAVTAVVTPITDDLVQNLQDGAVAPAPAPETVGAVAPLAPAAGRTVDDLRTHGASGRAPHTRGRYPDRAPLSDVAASVTSWTPHK